MLSGIPLITDTDGQKIENAGENSLLMADEFEGQYRYPLPWSSVVVRACREGQTLQFISASPEHGQGCHHKINIAHTWKLTGTFTFLMFCLPTIQPEAWLVAQAKLRYSFMGT